MSGSDLGGSFDWHENDGMTPPSFTRHPIATGLDRPRTLLAVDGSYGFDGDGAERGPGRSACVASAAGSCD